ncbi:MAG TPA: threonine synthase [Acidimicrobiia bacterium]|nr:threonine synthase [Acidimicrobiia bacterium]
MSAVLRLRCLVCGRSFRPDEIVYVCPDHGSEGVVDVEYDYPAIAASWSPDTLPARDGMWRYEPLLPVDAVAAAPPILVGGTPLIDAPRLAATAGLGPVWVKDEGRQPTASLKDRASAMAVVKAAEAGFDTITTASTGNAAAALAGMCAAAGTRAVIFVPESAPQAKITQLLVFGASVVLVAGTYDQAVELSMEAADRRGWYNRNTGFNPYMTEGKKTVVYEICEQLGWRAPDAIAVGVGDGSIIGGLHKGLRDLLALGWIDRMPRLIGVQAEGSQFLAEAWRNGEDPLTKPPAPADTVADSISAGMPRDRLKAMAAVLETDGVFVTVTDDEILAAIPAVARGCGVFGEPAAAAAWAGTVVAERNGFIGGDDEVVVISTGSGLKDVAAATRGAEAAGVTVVHTSADLGDLDGALDRLTTTGAA